MTTRQNAKSTRHIRNRHGRTIEVVHAAIASEREHRSPSQAMRETHSSNANKAFYIVKES